MSGSSLWGPGTRPPTRHEVALRFVVTATALVALAGLGATGLMHPLPGVLAGVVAVLASLVLPAVDGPRRAGPQTVLAASTLLAVPLMSWWLLDQRGVGLLTALAAGAVAGVALEPPVPRSTLLRIWVNGAVLALSAAGAAGSSLVVTCLVVGGVGMLVALALWQRASVLAGGAAAADHPRTRRSGRSRVTWLAGPVAVGLVLALVGAWALSRIPQPPSSGGSGGGSGLSDVLRGGGAGGDTGGGDPDPSGRSRGDRDVQGYLGGPLDLSTRGDLGDTPMFEVPGRPTPVLWRVAVHASYDHGRWTRDQQGADVVVSMTLPPGGGDVGPLPDDPFDPTRAATATGVVGVLGGATGPVPVMAPGTVTGVTTEGPTLVDPRLSILTMPQGDLPLPGYTVRWRERPDVAQLLAAEAAPQVGGGRAVPARPPDAERWLALPDSVPPRVADLGQRLVDQARDSLAAQGRPASLVPAAAAAAIEAWLRGHATYSLDAPQPDRGQDPVDAFLFEDRIGYCEHFATASVVMLRAAGIPARLAAGYAAPASRRSDQPLLPRVTLTSAMAHAWVEVYVEGVGWVSSDPTAGVPLAEVRKPLRERVASWLGEHLVAIGVAAAALAVAVLALWWLRRRRRAAAWGAGAAPPEWDDAARDLWEALRRFEQAMAARGSGRSPEETLGDLASRIRAGTFVVREAAAHGAVAPAGVGGGSASGMSVLRGAAAPDAASRASAQVLADVLADVPAALAVVERVVYSARMPSPAELVRATSVLDAAARAARG